MYNVCRLFTIGRYARAERELKQARPYGEGATRFYAVAEIEPPKEDPKELLVAITSDRGKTVDHSRSISSLLVLLSSACD